MDDCPICGSRCCVERQAHGWRFCASCTKEFQVDSDGQVVKVYTKDPDRWAHGKYET